MPRRASPLVVPTPAGAGTMRPAADEHRGAQLVAEMGSILKWKPTGHRSLQLFPPFAPERGKRRLRRGPAPVSCCISHWHTSSWVCSTESPGSDSEAYPLREDAVCGTLLRFGQALLRRLALRRSTPSQGLLETLRSLPERRSDPP